MPITKSGDRLMVHDFVYLYRKPAKMAKSLNYALRCYGPSKASGKGAADLPEASSAHRGFIGTARTSARTRWSVSKEAVAYRKTKVVEAEGIPLVEPVGDTFTTYPVTSYAFHREDVCKIYLARKYRKLCIGFMEPTPSDVYGDRFEAWQRLTE